MSKIGIQGGEASYHEMIAQKLYPGTELIYYDTFKDLFDGLRKKQIDSAIAAIANNRIQFIPATYEELVHGKKDLTIVGEAYLRVEHALLGTKGASIQDIKEIHSQVLAIGQCRDFIERNLPNAKIVEQHDTAGSAKMVAEWRDKSKAAIASTKAAEKYGLDIIRTAIQDDPDNITRFLVLKLSVDNNSSANNKTTIILKTPQVAGALVEALLPFKQEGISLSNLHSRIVPNSAFDMDFFLEFEAGTQDDRAKKLLKELRDSGHEYTILGSYQRAEIPIDKV